MVAPFARCRLVCRHSASRRGSSARAPDSEKLELSRSESGAPFGVRFMVGGIDVDVVPSVSIPPGGVDLSREKDAGRTAEKVASKICVVVV